MKLFITGAQTTNEFKLGSISIENGQVTVNSDALATHIFQMELELKKARAVIANMPDDALAPPAPAAPVEPVFEIVEATNLQYTIDQYKASGWTEQQLLDAGHLIKREVTQADAAPAAPAPGPASTIPDVPASPSKAVIAGQFEANGVLYMMSAKAAGASYEQFTGSGWVLDALLAEGYASRVGGEPEPTATPAEEKTFPFMNAQGDWEDSAGTIWDVTKHSMSSTTKIPPVTTKGIFKKTRAKAKPSATPTPANDVPAVPEAGNIPSAPGNAIPSAPEAASVPEVPGALTIDAVPDASTIEDEPLDDELAGIVKNWG